MVLIILIVLVILVVLILLVLVVLLILLQQLLGQRVVILRLHIVGVQHQRAAIALQRILQLLLHKLRIAEVIVRLGAILRRLQRVGRRSLQQGLRLLEITATHLGRRALGVGVGRSVGHSHTNQRISQIIARLKRGAVVLQRLAVGIRAMLVALLGKEAVTLAHQPALGHTLCRGIDHKKAHHPAKQYI